jgi:hypothetical protein
MDEHLLARIVRALGRQIPRPSVLKEDVVPRRRLPRFQVVLQASSRHQPVVLRAAADSDQATIAFDDELQRLTTQGVMGELILLNHNKGGGPILRYPLRPSRASQSESVAYEAP